MGKVSQKESKSLVFEIVFLYLAVSCVGGTREIPSESGRTISPNPKYRPIIVNQYREGKQKKHPGRDEMYPNQPLVAEPVNG